MVSLVSGISYTATVAAFMCDNFKDIYLRMNDVLVFLTNDESGFVRMLTVWAISHEINNPEPCSLRWIHVSSFKCY